MDGATRRCGPPSSPDTALVPHTFYSAPHFNLLGNFSLDFFSTLGVATAVAIVLSVMLSEFFDTMGTVVGIAGEAKLLPPEGKLPGINRVLLVDSLAAAAGGAASASSNTTYMESAAGVSKGGRTGLTSVVVGVPFLLSLFLSSLAGVIPPEATAPILIIVGYFMMTLRGSASGPCSRLWSCRSRSASRTALARGSCPTC
jgi:AGZA family xanthine/uracil permease-like MFS transporter